MTEEKRQSIIEQIKAGATNKEIYKDNHISCHTLYRDFSEYLKDRKNSRNREILTPECGVREFWMCQECGEISEEVEPPKYCPKCNRGIFERVKQKLRINIE